jgi:S-adenosylmethionine synthetase
MFTSESVTAGHPDKLCDQISDAIIDQFLIQDPYARVRAECAVSSAVIFIAARFASTAKVDLSRAARKVIKRIGYDQPDFNANICSILSTPKELEIDERSRFDERTLTDEAMERIHAQNQVTVFGFACDQTPEYMPYPICLAHKIMRQMDAVFEKRILPYLLPDSTVQVGVEYCDGRPARIHTITLIAGQKDLHKPDLKTLKDDIVDTVMEPLFKDQEIKPDEGCRLFVSPGGPFPGGPSHHPGLTGRKNAVDTYGEYSRHSGKSLSGKDPLRVDRIGAYAARYVAKNLVAAKLATQCEVILSYAIGMTQPVTMHVRNFGTGKYSEQELEKLVTRHFDFRLAGILRKFNLRHLPAGHPEGFYEKLSAYGHVGRLDMNLPWEKTDLAEILAAG